MADDEQVAALEAELPRPGMSLANAAQKVRQAAGRRGWLSPKSQSALNNLHAGRASLDRGERNALDYLLGRLSDAGVLTEDISQLRSALSEDATATGLPDTDPERPRRRSWAIWRAR